MLAEKTIKPDGEREREREGVNNLKMAGKKSDVKSGQMEKQRKSVRWWKKTAGVSLRPKH